MNKLIKVCEYLLFISFLILVPFFKEKLSIFLGIPVVLLIYFFNKKSNIKNFPLIIFIVALITRIFTSIYLKVEIVDDFKVMLDASTSLIKNDLSFLDTFYFKTFSYQLGHVLYQALLLKIINKVLFLKIINSIVTSLTVVFIYLISKELFKEKTARIISILYLFYLYPLYLNSILTNQLLPALLCLIVIYLIIKKQLNYKLAIIISILLVIANILRTESIIYIMGIVLYYLLMINKKNYKNILKNIVIIISTYFILMNSISLIISITPIKTKLVNNAPTWKFYCGLSDKYNGRYNEEDQNIYFSKNSNGKKLLEERIKQDKFKFPILFLKKEVILWTQTNYDLKINNNINGNLYSFILHFNQGYLNLIIVLFIFSLISIKKEKREVLLLKIIIGLYYGIYMLIEISPRYAYILHILIFILLGVGIEKITEIIKRRCKHAKI